MTIPNSHSVIEMIYSLKWSEQMLTQKMFLVRLQSQSYFR